LHISPSSDFHLFSLFVLHLREPRKRESDEEFGVTFHCSLIGQSVARPTCHRPQASRSFLTMLLLAESRAKALISSTKMQSAWRLWLWVSTMHAHCPLRVAKLRLQKKGVGRVRCGRTFLLLPFRLFRLAYVKPSPSSFFCLKMRSNIFAFALNFMALLAAAYAIAVNTTELGGGANKDVFVPKIYAPAQGTVWTPGTQQVVEW